jgi:hypothetical protein
MVLDCPATATDMDNARRAATDRAVFIGVHITPVP